jgi:RHS repeat-associated protein
LDSTGPQGLSAGAYYPLQDLLYRTTALTDDEGNIVEAYDTDAYGNTLIFSAADGSDNWWSDTAVQSSWSACQFIFTGQRFDAETGNYYYKERYYSAIMGRFLSRDPIGYETKGSNLYTYCADNPMLNIDPKGMSWSVYENSKGQICGYSIWLLTGSWCADPNVVIAAADRYDQFATCWWNCEVRIHKCACTYVAAGAAAACTVTFTHLEIAKGQVRQGLGSPGDVTTLQSALALWMAQNGYKGAVQNLLRTSAQQVSANVVSSGATSCVAGVGAVEAAISFYCSWQCSQ